MGRTLAIFCSALLGFATAAGATQLPGPGTPVSSGAFEIVPLTPEQETELTTWLTALKKWQAYDEKWRNRPARDSWGRIAERRPSPTAPDWLDPYCASVAAAGLTAFEERTEQVLRLLSHAVRHTGDDKTFQKKAKAHAQEAVALGIRSGSMPADEMQKCLTACYPLHPITAAILGPLFRQIAQNERSLFAFLASNEPFGFQEFLRDCMNAGCEVRLVALSEGENSITFYAHPLGRDGATMDYRVEGDTLTRIRAPLEMLQGAN